MRRPSMIDKGTVGPRSRSTHSVAISSDRASDTRRPSWRSIPRTIHGTSESGTPDPTWRRRCAGSSVVTLRERGPSETTTGTTTAASGFPIENGRTEWQTRHRATPWTPLGAPCAVWGPRRRCRIRCGVALPQTSHGRVAECRPRVGIAVAASSAAAFGASGGSSMGRRNLAGTDRGAMGLPEFESGSRAPKARRMDQ